MSTPEDLPSDPYALNCLLRDDPSTLRELLKHPDLANMLNAAELPPPRLRCTISEIGSQCIESGIIPTGSDEFKLIIGFCGRVLNDLSSTETVAPDMGDDDVDDDETGISFLASSSPASAAADTIAVHDPALLLSLFTNSFAALTGPTPPSSTAPRAVKAHATRHVILADAAIAAVRHHGPAAFATAAAAAAPPTPLSDTLRALATMAIDVRPLVLQGDDLAVAAAVHTVAAAISAPSVVHCIVAHPGAPLPPPLPPLPAAHATAALLTAVVGAPIASSTPASSTFHTAPSAAAALACLADLYAAAMAVECGAPAPPPAAICAVTAAVGAPHAALAEALQRLLATGATARLVSREICRAVADAAGTSGGRVAVQGAVAAAAAAQGRTAAADGPVAGGRAARRGSSVWVGGSASAVAAAVLVDALAAAGRRTLLRCAAAASLGVADADVAAAVAASDAVSAAAAADSTPTPPDTAAVALPALSRNEVADAVLRAASVGGTAVLVSVLLALAGSASSAQAVGVCAPPPGAAAAAAAATVPLGLSDPTTPATAARIAASQRVSRAVADVLRAAVAAHTKGLGAPAAAAALEGVAPAVVWGAPEPLIAMLRRTFKFSNLDPDATAAVAAAAAATIHSALDTPPALLWALAGTADGAASVDAATRAAHSAAAAVAIAAARDDDVGALVTGGVTDDTHLALRAAVHALCVAVVRLADTPSLSTPDGNSGIRHVNGCVYLSAMRERLRLPPLVAPRGVAVAEADGVRR